MEANFQKSLLAIGVGFLGCAGILTVASGVVFWLQSTPPEPTYGEEADDTMVNKPLSSNEKVEFVETEAHSQDSVAAEVPAEPPTDAVVELRMVNLGYKTSPLRPPWMMDFPQVVNPNSLWEKIKTQDQISTDAQVGLCLIKLDSDYRWDPLRGAPDPYLRVSYNNAVILDYQQSNVYSAYFSFWRPSYETADIFSFELYDFDALNKNDFVATWAFTLSEMGTYQHTSDKSVFDCRFLSLSEATESAASIVGELDLRSQLQGTPSSDRVHFGFPRDAHLDIQRKIQGVAALLGSGHETVHALLEQERTVVRHWLEKVTPVLQTAYHERQSVQQAEVGNWGIGLSRFECPKAPFCRLEIDLKPEGDIDLAAIERSEPLAIYVVDQSGVEHAMKRTRFLLSGESVSEYDLKHKAVPVGIQDPLSVTFSLPCRDCEGLAAALREDVQLIRIHLNGESELISLRR